MKKMAKNGKRRKDLDGIRSKLGRDYIIQIKNIDEEWMQKKSESWSKELLIDDDVTI